jgi:hypothetical protein
MCARNSKTKVEHHEKSVIENKLLAALEDEGTVAALLTWQDIEDLTFALDRSAALFDWDTTRTRRAYSLREDLNKLLKVLPK